MDHFWAALANWISRIEPGNWSEWFGGIVTSGSLFLGFYLLFDGRRRDRRSHVEKLALFITSPFSRGKSGMYEWAMRFENRSEQFVTSPGFIVVGHKVPRKQLEQMQHSQSWPYRSLVQGTKSVVVDFFTESKLPKKDTLAAGGHFDFAIESDLRLENTDVYFFFFDEAGVRWIRERKTGKYLSDREFRSLDRMAAKYMY